MRYCMSDTLHRDNGVLHISDPQDGVRTLRAEPKSPDVFISKHTCRTAYPLDLIELILDVKGIGFVCDEISREENPDYVKLNLMYDVFAYPPPSSGFADARVLDFGSGSGASAIVLAREMNVREVIGVELNTDYIRIAERRADFYGIDKVTFLASPHGGALPDGIGTFDAAMMSAVWEHLLPAERHVILPLVWNVLRPGGILYLNQTPHRWFPIETHTARLPLINYFPDKITLWVTQRWSPMVKDTTAWEQLLRDGIRGGSKTEVWRILESIGANAELLEPSEMGIHDRIDLWYAFSNQFRPSRGKTFVRMAAKILKRLTGHVLVPALSLAIRKRSD